MPSGLYRRFSSRHHLLRTVVATIPFRPRSYAMNRPAHELGREVSFWVSAGVAQRLPSACRPPPPPRNCADTSPASLSPRHVLLVDDDAVTSECVAYYLRLNDLRVTPVESGKRMMQVLYEEAVDLVTLELKLRGEDGLQLAAQLRAASTIPL